MSRLPTLFVSHGAPSFALEPGIVGPQLAALGRAMPRPKAVLVVSPHWMTSIPRVGITARPDTIHDFGGFAPALYEIVYAAAGHPTLAQRTIELLRSAGWHTEADTRRGLDHGAWVPMLHLFPQADVPVFQLSMPRTLDSESAWAFGEALAPLADEGVLIVGSGTLTHNVYDFLAGRGREEGYAAEFAAWIRDAVVTGDVAQLRGALTLAPHAKRAHPTTEHFLPLLVAAGAANVACASGLVTVIHGGITHGVVSMDSFVFGDIISTPPTRIEPRALD